MAQLRTGVSSILGPGVMPGPPGLGCASIRISMTATSKDATGATIPVSLDPNLMAALATTPTSAGERYPRLLCGPCVLSSRRDSG